MVNRQLLRSSVVLVCLATAGVLIGCGGSSSSMKPPPTTGNVQSIAVDGGPVAGQIYPDGVFTTVTVCVPGSSTCENVPGILVDTGSFGLRILASAIPSLNLPELTGSGGTTFYNCVSFVDGSFLWGPVAQADVKMAGEVASKTSVHLVEDPTGFTVPTACSNGGVDEDSQMALGANGILGVGPESQDCGSACDPSTGGTPPAVYFTCVLTGNCQTAFVSVSQQVADPVVRFAQDNNGVLIQMQSISGGAAATATGSMIFGIGTQSNNQLGSATVFTLNSIDNFTTTFNGQTLNQSFIDSGSNGLFFPDSAIPQCASNIAPGFYCPTSTLNLSAQNMGANNAKNTVNFSVDNTGTLFQTNDAAFTNLAGPSGTGTCSPQNPGPCSFDWGMPFFYGRSIFTSIRGQSVPSGQPAAPWWAY